MVKKGRDFSDLTIIIPTLNEVENVGRILSAIRKLYYNSYVIVSDDGSEDGTAGVVRRVSRNDRRIMLLDRKKNPVKGLTASVVDAALLTKTDKIVVMDADMQHPVELVGRISDSLESCDLCVGVRTTVRKWGFFRRVLSKGISYFSFFVFVIRGKITCNDMMSGFFGIGGDLFRGTIKKNRKGFVYKGYKVLLDTMRMLDKNSTRVGELPYATFHDREAGKSKLRFRRMLEVVESTLK
jgi:dolichol-phosphate mannosyltransferase